MLFQAVADVSRNVFRLCQVEPDLEHKFPSRERRVDLHRIDACVVSVFESDEEERPISVFLVK